MSNTNAGNSGGEPKDHFMWADSKTPRARPLSAASRAYIRRTENGQHNVSTNKLAVKVPYTYQTKEESQDSNSAPTDYAPEPEPAYKPMWTPPEGFEFPPPRPRSPEAQAYIDYVERNYYRSFANPFPLQLRLLKASQPPFDRQAAFDALSSRPSQGNWMLLKNNLVVDINTGLMGMMIRGPRKATGVMHGISTVMPSERGSKLVARMMQYVQARRSQEASDAGGEIDERIPRFDSERNRDMRHYLTLMKRPEGWRFARRHSAWRDIGQLIFALRDKLRSSGKSTRSIPTQLQVGRGIPDMPNDLSPQEALQAMLNRRAGLWIGRDDPAQGDPNWNNVGRAAMPPLRRYTYGIGNTPISRSPGTGRRTKSYDVADQQDDLHRVLPPRRSIWDSPSEILLPEGDFERTTHPELGYTTRTTYKGDPLNSGIDIHVLPLNMQPESAEPLTHIPANAHALFRVSALSNEQERRAARERGIMFKYWFAKSKGAKIANFLKQLVTNTSEELRGNPAKQTIEPDYGPEPKIKNPRGPLVVHDTSRSSPFLELPNPSPGAVDYGEPPVGESHKPRNVTGYQVAVPSAGSRPDTFDLLANTLGRIQIDSAPAALRAAIMHQQRNDDPNGHIDLNDPTNKWAIQNNRPLLLRDRTGKPATLTDTSGIPQSVRDLPSDSRQNPVFRSVNPFPLQLRLVKSD